MATAMAISRGSISKLDYIAELGVDAIWLSPIHPSPNRDWGYDVSDYENVNPDYGSLADFERLLSAAHARGLRVMTDEVLAHTSDEHAWFGESLKGGDKADWYVWAPPREDGTAPNNWLVGIRRRGLGLSAVAARNTTTTNSCASSPSSTGAIRKRAKAALAVLDLWLARGVDGFRLDVANAYLHDACADRQSRRAGRQAHAA